MNINPLNTFINNNSDNKDCILFYYIKYKQNHENILYWLKQLDESILKYPKCKNYLLNINNKDYIYIGVYLTL